MPIPPLCTFSLSVVCDNVERRDHAALPSSLVRLMLGSMYSHQFLPSEDRGISSPFQRQERCMHTHATVLGVCSRQKVVSSRLQWGKG